MNQNPTRSLKQILLKRKGKDESEDVLTHFADFLEKCTILDPNQRMGPEEAVSHPFLGLV